MDEYAIVSGKNFFGIFLNTIEPSIYPVQSLFAKIGLNLSTGEACFVSFTIITVVVGSLVLLIIK